MRRFLRFYSDPAKLVSTTLIGLAIFFAVASAQVGLWDSGMPGPGLTSFFGSVLLIPISLATFASHKLPEEDDSLRLVPLLGGAAICLFAWVLPTLGFAISIAALMLFLMSVLQKRSWIQGVVTAVVISGVLVTLFYYVLMVPIQIWTDWS
jgi:hypothetical protein